MKVRSPNIFKELKTFKRSNRVRGATNDTSPSNQVQKIFIVYCKTKTPRYVLIQTVPGRIEAIIRSLSRMPTVGTVDPVTGPYDIVALLEVGDIREISHLVAGTIGGMRGVTRTTTLICT